MVNIEKYRKISTFRSILDYKPNSVLDIIEIHPDRFLDLANQEAIDNGDLPITCDKLDKSIIKRIAKSIKDNGLRDLPFIDIDINTGRVVSHEGRHRACALKELGKNIMPVAVFARDGDYGLINVNRISYRSKKMIQRSIPELDIQE